MKDTRDRSVTVEAPYALDQAAAYLSQTVEYLPLTPDAERKLVRKIDWVIIPMVCVL
jgi:hypothetical protein